MIINNIDIKYYHFNDLVYNQSNLFHKKTLPHLSIVQATEGAYFIQIDNSKKYYTGEMGVFIAPPNKMQYITHCLSSSTKTMKAHWVFLDIIINNRYHIEDLFDFPILMPAVHNSTIYKLLQEIGNGQHICDKYSAIYQLLKLLFLVSSKKNAADNFETLISSYISSNYSKSITINELIEISNLSAASLFRKCKEILGCTPMEYINQVRIANAALLLETTDLKVKDISEATGFSDQFYFSKVFSKINGISPREYRNSYQKKQ